MTIDELIKAFDDLGWNPDDDIRVEIGGTAVSGIHQPPEANERWSTPFGVRKYNKDAFLVIKNHSRTLFEPSKPNETTDT